jgi:LPS-assembly protein
MRCSARIKAALAGLAVVFLAAVLQAQVSITTTDGLTVHANAGERDKDRIVVTGAVEVLYKDIRLLADSAELNTKTKDVVARGHVTIQMPSENVDCEEITFNLDTTLGNLKRALGRIQPSVIYEADSVAKKTDNLYSLEKAYFTSCTQPVPRWKFSFSKANFKKDDYVEMWNAVLKIKTVPVFYWPYMRYPLNRERSTGFLMPNIGFSKVKGFIFSETFYWAIARNMDASFSFDYYGAKGTGGGLETRYLFGDGTQGDAHLYFFVFKPAEGETTSTDSYIIRWNHRQLLPGGFTLAGNVDYQNSFQFTREFDNDIMRALVFNRSSQVYLTKAWSSYNFSLRAARFETSFPTLNASIITDYLPQINFDSFTKKLLGPLYFSFSSSFTRWQYGWDRQYKDGTQLSNTQFELTPTLSLPFNAIPWLTMNVSTEQNLKYYWKTKQEDGSLTGTPVWTYNSAFGVDFVGPVFYRIYDLAVGEDGTAKSRLKHIIEPSVSYRYETPIINGDKVFNPYGLYRYHAISYGLTNHLLLKQGPSPQEIVTLGISQVFYIAPETGPMQYFRWNGEIPRFSEISSYLRIYPGGGLSFDGAASFNTYTKGFSSLRLGANLGSLADVAFLSLSWYKSMNPWMPDPWYDRSQIGAFGGLNLAGLNLELKGQADFNLTESKLLFAGVSGVYHYQCLDLKADLRMYFFRDVPDVQFKISFGLGNIGKTTDFLGGARFD